MIRDPGPTPNLRYTQSMSASRVPDNELPRYNVEFVADKIIIHSHSIGKYVIMKGADRETVEAVIDCVNALELDEALPESLHE